MEEKMKKKRSSNIELLRIIFMLVIIAHHYVVNSDVINIILSNVTPAKRDIILLFFGSGGKIGINVFVLITGFFMCTQKITVKKFLKLFLEIEFYNIVIYLIFAIFKYEVFNFSILLKRMFIFEDVTSSFISCYLLFFLSIPFINKLINSMNKKEHLKLIALFVFIYSILGSMRNIVFKFNYISWFIILYLIGAYIRLYPNKYTKNNYIMGICLAIIIALWMLSVKKYLFYYVIDSNKILALLVAVFSFIFAKNIEMKSNKIINSFSQTCLGVLMIHANSNAMRTWLWKNLFRTASQYNNEKWLLCAIGTVFLIFLVCACIDLIRIYAIEKPFFKLYDICEEKIKQRRKTKIEKEILEISN